MFVEEKAKKWCRRSNRTVEGKVEVKKTRKMAERALEKGGSSDGSGKKKEEGNIDKGREEAGKRRLRSTVRGSGEGNVFEEEKAGLRSFLEKGILTGGEDEIVRGNVLERTPVKKRESEMMARENAGKEEITMNGRGRKIKTHSPWREREWAEPAGDKDGGAAEERSMGREEDVRKVSAGALEWVEIMLERVKELENKLNAEKECRRALERAMGDLKEGNKEYKNKMEKLQGLISVLLEQAESDRGKIGKLEMVILGGDGQCEGGVDNNMKGRGKVKDSETEKTHRDKENEINEAREERIRREMSSDCRSPVRIRKYLAEIPENLSKNEWEWEMRERKNRKKNLVIKGLRGVGKGIKDEVRGIIKNYLRMDIYIERIRVMGGGILVELQSMENKVMIMKRKGMLKGVDIWIKDDYTVREKQVQDWLEKLGEEERILGHEVKVGYQKVKVDEDWYVWGEREGRLSQMTVRGEGEKNDCL